MRDSTKGPRLLALTAAAVLLFASEARADGIDMSMVFVAGLTVLAPLLAFNVLVEGLVLARGLKVGYRAVLAIALGANIASLLAGIPVAIFDECLHYWLLPSDLAPYFRAFPWVVALGTLVYFAVTVLVEFGVVYRWSKRRSLGLGMKRVALTVLLANLATYAVLGPLNYFVTRPTSDVREFTDTSAWAAKPLTTLYYIDEPGHRLSSIASDGTGKRVIVPAEVKTYEFTPGATAVLYADSDDTLRLWRTGDAAPTALGKDSGRSGMSEAALSPDGQRVAWLRREAPDPTHRRLVVFDAPSRRTVETSFLTAKSEESTGLAWSESPGLFFLVVAEKTLTVRLDAELKASLSPCEPGDGAPAAVFGRFNETGVLNYHEDSSNGTEAWAVMGLGSYLSVKRNGKEILFSVNPGLIKFAGRYFREVCILPNGRELVFDDGHALYLMDMDRRVVGKIADGTSCAIETGRYRQALPR